jgi:hypothetical protein
MSSTGDPAVNVIVVEDAAVVIASDDNDGDMQASAKSKRKRQKTLVSVGICQGLARRRLRQALRKAPVHCVSQVVL